MIKCVKVYRIITIANLRIAKGSINIFLKLTNDMIKRILILFVLKISKII